MILIVGLGNPGQKFQKTRHNIGFRIAEKFAKKNNFPKFKSIRKFNAEISEKISIREKVVLAKPRTFMNLSGKSVKLLTRSYNLEAKNLIIVHDDIDLPLGKIRITIGRGAAGHKGVESVIKELKTKNFVRFRVGIQPKTGKPQSVEKFVLQKFNKDEEKIMKGVIKKAVEAIEITLKKGVEKAMSKFN